jgi:DHA1 family bicyclomycin/chloramphenicol resistance-like MFS transporter
MPAPPVAPRLPHGIGNRMLVALIGCCLMLQPVSTDLYLASLPGLTRTFATSIATVQLTLSVWVGAFGVMQLVAGPLADRHGRYPVLVGGLGLYVVASIACALAPSIDLLIAARALQAVGCCAAVVVARAVVRDVYTPQAGAKALAQASTILAIGPIAGPILGSFLEVRFGHRAAFVVLALLASLLLATVLAKRIETNRYRNPAALRPRALIANYAHVLRSPEFLAYTLVGAASYGGLFAFISGSPLVLIRVLGVPTAYFGLAFAFCVCGYLVGTIACRRLLSHMSVPRALRVGAAVALASGATMAALAALGIHHWAALVLPAFGYLLAHGINFPCGQVSSVAPFPRHAGAASAMFGFSVMIVAGLTGTWVGASYNGSVYPLALTMAAFTAVLFGIVYGWVARLEARTAVRQARYPEGADTPL